MMGCSRRAAPTCVLAAVFFLLAGCAGVGPRSLDLAEEARRTFDGAYVMLETKEGFTEGRMDSPHIPQTLARIRTARATVVFVHGCAGLGPGNLRYMHLLAEAGYVVVAPDSFARRWRPETCVPAAHTFVPGAPFRRVGRMRQEEIHHAAYRLLRTAWADRKNLFLMGHSQGGAAAAAYEGEEFNAHVVSGATCARGVRVPRTTPVLAFYSKDDPWRRGRPADRCLRRAKERGVNMRFHLFEGNRHNLSRDETARRLILDFLAAHRKAE